ncbi:hypothetical protein PFISCL1PPCAC_15046, partial [Pristionchus fissidentatus]
RPSLPASEDIVNLHLRNFFDVNVLTREKKSWIKTECSRFDPSINRRNGIFLLWSLLVSIACLYNLLFSTVLIYEAIWTHFYSEWILLNLLSDSIYILDMLIQLRTNYYHKGVKISARSKTALNYLRSSRFIFDCISIIPTDIFLIIAPNISLLRINRFFKCYRIRETIDLIETKASFHTLFSIFQIILVCLIIFHWNACAYYAMSLWSYTVMEEVGDDDWPFTFERVSDLYYARCESFRCQDDLFDESNRDVGEREEYVHELVQFWSNKTEVNRFSLFSKEYSQTFYWSALTMTTLGEQPEPNLSEHNLMEIGDTIVGVLIFAAIMGSVADLIAQSNALRTSQQTLIDGLKQYMDYRNLTGEIHTRVVAYSQYSMDRGVVLSEEVIKEKMPRKLYLRVNKFNQSSMFDNNSFFAGLDDRLLQDIASKLRIFSFSPGDEIVSIGDFNREMFLLCTGELFVFSVGDPIPRICKTEGEMLCDSTLFWFDGDKFDHRSQMKIVSHGYSEVYILERKDLLDVLIDYDDVRSIIVGRARKDQLSKGRISNPKAGEVTEMRTFTQRVDAIRKGIETLTRRIEDERLSFNVSVENTRER